MTERKLTMVPVEVDGYCDPEAGFCALPAPAAEETAEVAATDAD